MKLVVSDIKYNILYGFWVCWQFIFGSSTIAPTRCGPNWWTGSVSVKLFLSLLFFYFFVLVTILKLILIAIPVMMMIQILSKLSQVCITMLLSGHMYIAHFLAPLEPKEFCSCKNCIKMNTLEESVCCRSSKYDDGPGKCVCDNPYVDYVLQDVGLEVNLRYFKLL